MKKKIVTMALISIVGILIFIQAVYYCFLSVRPNFMRDEFGMAYNGAAIRIWESQKQYHLQNGKYAHDLKKLMKGKIDSEKFLFGYAGDFSTDIAALCSECIFGDETYKVIVVLKGEEKSTIWSIDSSGDFRAIGSITSNFEK